MTGPGMTAVRAIVRGTAEALMHNQILDMELGFWQLSQLSFDKPSTALAAIA